MTLGGFSGLMPSSNQSAGERVLIAAFVVPGEPYSKARPRVTKKGTYTPQNTVDQTQRVHDAFTALDLPDYNKAGTFRMDAHFYLGTMRRADGDNLLKLVKDALNKVAYEDDYLVYDARAIKWHTTKDRARTEVFLYQISGERKEKL